MPTPKNSKRQFFAVDCNGGFYCATKETEYLEVPNRRLPPQWVELTTVYRLADGRHLSRRSDNKLEIVGTDVVLTAIGL